MIVHAFPSRGTGMCAQACSIAWLAGNLRSITIGVISRSFICLWTEGMWGKRTAQLSWGNASVNGRRKPCAVLIRQRPRLPVRKPLRFEHRSRRRSKPPKSSVGRLSARVKRPLCLHNKETPFERRFQALLRQAWLQRSWHVIVAEPGSGKTMGIGDLRDEAARQAGMVGGRRYPVLAVTAPKNDPREAALGNLLLGALGVGARGRWSERKYLLYDLLGHYGVECLICDDAHDLSMPHLIFLKELTDHLFLAYPSHPLGLCLVTAGRGVSIPLKDVFDQEDDDVDAIPATAGLPSALLSRH